MIDAASQAPRTRFLFKSRWRLSPVVVILLGSTAMTMLFWRVIPASFRLTEATDYHVFYEPVARSVLAGKGLTSGDGEPATKFPPGYPLVLAGVLGASHRFHVSEDFGLSALAVLSMSLISLFIFLMARMIWGDRVAAVSSLLWMTYPFALWLTKQPNSEMPFTVLLYGGLGLFWYLVMRRTAAKLPFMLCGFLFGLAMLIRPIAIGIGFVLAGILWFVRRDAKRRLRLALISMLLVGSLVAVFPWEAWVYSKTGKVILLSNHGASSLRIGLTFALRGDGVSDEIKVSPEVASVMKNVDARSGEMATLKNAAAIIAGEFRDHPVATSKLYLLKTARSWYATDSGRKELTVMLIQIPYLGLALWSFATLWRRGGVNRDFAIGALLIVIYFWLMTILALSILRYMVPVTGLLFIVTSAAVFATKNERATWVRSEA